MAEGGVADSVGVAEMVGGRKEYQVWFVDVVNYGSSGKKGGECDAVGAEHFDNRLHYLWKVSEQFQGKFHARFFAK